MSVAVDILYKKNPAFFFPGETIKGEIEITLAKVKVIKEIKLKIKGHAKVRWSEYDSKNKKRNYYSQTEEYYNFVTNIMKNYSSSATQIGVHRFPFNFILPSGIPCSFEYKYGFVKHTCKAIVDLETSFFDSTCKVLFSVGSLLDLNFVPSAKQPIFQSEDKTICCLCCAGGELSFTLNIDHSGYVPGERIMINAECSNHSNRSTNHTKAEIRQKITYKAHSKTKKVERTVATMSHGGTEPGGDDIWSQDGLLVPPLPPSGMPDCSIIDIKYKFMFAFSPSGISMDLTSTQDLWIGAVPLRQVFSAFLPLQPPLAALPSQPPSIVQPPYAPPFVLPPFDSPSAPPFTSPSAPPVGFGLPSAPPSEFDPPPPYPWAELYPELPPPSYESCALGQEDSENHSDSSDASIDPSSDGATPSRRTNRPSAPFSPRYVTYNWKVT